MPAALKKILVVLTATYPFGTGESFIESEVNHYGAFDQTYIFPVCQIQNDEKRNTPENVTVVKNIIGTSEGNDFFWNVETLNELLFQFQKGKFSDTSITKMNDFYKNAILFANAIDEYLKKQGVGKTDKIVFYSYWLYTQSLTAVFLKRKYKNSIAVSRCHGYDVFETRADDGYLPFRKLLLRSLDMVFPIASMEKKYLRETYPSYAKNIMVARLGTTLEEKDKMEAKELQEKKTLRIVSCSNIISLKRLPIMIDAFSKIEDIPIEWTHIGSGNQKDRVLRLCKEKLGANIDYKFLGQISNLEVKKIYQEKKFHLFLNMSETEGLPVSIMEAASFGIPVIATDVGGTSEILCNGKNGYLVPANVTADEVAGFIRKIYHMEMDEYNQLRTNSYKIWKKHYQAEENYRKFIQLLYKMSLNKISREDRGCKHVSL